MKWTLINQAGTNDPETGDIYSGLDRFGRVKDNRWIDGQGADLDRIQYGYDRAGNRIWRHNAVAAALDKEFDELYSYDGVHRLQDMTRGTLNAQRTALTSETFAQCWTLDATGNWRGFREDDNGDGTWNLIQQRTANPVNEITDIAETAGPTWVTPAYSPAGNMTTMPKVADPTVSQACQYDAWNRLTKVTEGANTVAQYQYDGAKRRIVQKNYESGVPGETRHLYYTEPSQWQVIEERIGTSPDSADAERQFVWGLRYIDDLVLRDRDTDDNGSLDERLYACQDANWNVTAASTPLGDVDERYAYTVYGRPVFLTSTFGIRMTSDYDWETTFAAYRYSLTTALYHIRNRVYQSQLGIWVQRDPHPDRLSESLYEYVISRPTVRLDPKGLVAITCDCGRWVNSGGGPTTGGSWDTFHVDVDCTRRGDDCCRSACSDSGGRPIAPGAWSIVGSGPSSGAIGCLLPLFSQLMCEGERRRGSRGPGDDSSHHCWAACTAARCLPIPLLVQGGAVIGDIAEVIADIIVVLLTGHIDVGDSARDIAAHHQGAHCAVRAAMNLTSCDMCCGTCPRGPACS